MALSCTCTRASSPPPLGCNCCHRIIDGKVVVNNDGLHGMTTVASKALTLDKGRHSFRVEYFNREGPGGLIVEWQGPGTSRSVVPASALFSSKPVPRGLLAKFYATPRPLSALPAFPPNSNLLKTIVVKNLNFPSSYDFGNLGISTRFAGVFEGYITVPKTGKWTFFTSSAQGSKLYIDDSVVVNNNGVHGNTEKEGTLHLIKGSHSFRVEYFNGDGRGNLVVSWKGPKVDKQIIPDKAFTKASTLGSNHCQMFSSYNENSLTSASGRGNSDGSTYILVRAKIYANSNFVNPISSVRDAMRRQLLALRASCWDHSTSSRPRS